MRFLRKRRDIITMIVALTCIFYSLQPLTAYAGSEDALKSQIETEVYGGEMSLAGEENESEGLSETGRTAPEKQCRTEATESESQTGTETAEQEVQSGTEIAVSEVQSGTEEAESESQVKTEITESESQAETETAEPVSQTGTETTEPAIESETEESETDVPESEGEAEKELSKSETAAADITEDTAEEACVGASPFQFVSVDGGVCVTGYTGSDVKLTIPSSIDGKSVVSVGTEAFRGAQITSITLPSTLTALGTRCFYYCEDLQTVNMNACLKLNKIGEGAFALCGLITSVKVPDSVTLIEDDAFFSCSSLKTVTIGKCVEKIGSYAFALCRNLEGITLPAGVTTVDSNAFEKCEKMINISMAGVREIGNNAFAFTAASAVKVPAVCKTIGAGAFHDCGNLASVTLQEGLQSVGRTAFANCPKLLTVTVPNTVTGIGDAAFGCSWGWDGTAEYIRPNTSFKVRAYKADGAAAKYATRYGMAFVRITKTVSTAVISGISKTYNYIGSALKPAPTVKDGNVTLKVGQDYSLTYSGNIEPGTATITVKGIGNYSGKLTKTFTVAPYPIYGARITATTASSTYDYTGYARKPGVTVKFNGQKLTAGTDYTLSYSNNTNPGTATITLTGKGRFRLTRNVTFKLALTVPTVTRAVKKSAGTMLITWNKYNKARGYQVRIARGTNEKIYTVPGASSLSKTITGLTTNQTWRVYVRSYQKIGDKYYYSAWSGVKYVKV